MTRNATNAGIDRRAHSEAEHWLAKLLDMDAQDPARAEFDRWLAVSPTHASAYRAVERLWALSQEAAGHPDIMTVADRIPCVASATLPRSLRSRLVPTLAIAAMLITMTGLGLYWWYAIAVDQTGANYATTIGQQRTVTLKDGSTLLLDTDSAVVVRYGHRSRQVNLLRGRVEFSVRHNADRPFIVHAGAGTVTDVGTTFQVGLGGSGDVNVVLIAGSVSVAAAQSSEVTLTRGEALQFDHAGIVRSAHPVDLSTAIGWTHGEVVAHDWRLPRLLAEMNRYSTTRLVIADPALRNVRITGSFRAGAQQTLVEVLQAGWSIRVVQASPERVLLFRE
ncbi:MAG: FecR family protein [Rhodanobacteraceae bacterium]